MKTFAIGDLHGHLTALERLLAALEEKYQIFAKENVLKPGFQIIFLGDYIDRGSQSRDVLLRVKTLRDKNPEQVFCLLGNHELLALGCLDFAKQLSEENTFDDDEIFHLYKFSPHGGNGGVTVVQNFAGATEREQMKAYSQEFSREGELGQFIRSLLPHKLVEAHGKKILYVHGGIPMDVIKSKEDMEAYSHKIVQHMQQKTRVNNAEEKYLGSLMGQKSIFWDRTLPTGPASRANAVAQSLEVDAIVVGHTPQKQITPLGSHVYLIDVGMCPRYGENDPATLVIDAEGIHAFYVEKDTKTLSA